VPAGCGGETVRAGGAGTTSGRSPGRGAPPPRAPAPPLQRAAPAWARGVGGTGVRSLYPDDRRRGRSAPWAAGRIRSPSATHLARRPRPRYGSPVEWKRRDLPDDPIMRWEWEGGAPVAVEMPRPAGEAPTGRAERRGHGGVFVRPGGRPQPGRIDAGRGARTRRRVDPANGV